MFRHITVLTLELSRLHQTASEMLSLSNSEEQWGSIMSGGGKTRLDITKFFLLPPTCCNNSSCLVESVSGRGAFHTCLAGGAVTCPVAATAPLKGEGDPGLADTATGCDWSKLRRSGSIWAGSGSRATWSARRPDQERRPCSTQRRRSRNANDSRKIGMQHARNMYAQHARNTCTIGHR